MKAFKPQMKDGHGTTIEMSPEAKAEWLDKPGKHNVGTDTQTVRGMKPTVKETGVDGFEPMKGPKQASLKKHEGAIKAKGKEHGHSNTDSGPAASIKHKTGPMKGAGKGKEGKTKGFAKANKKGVGGAGH